MKKESKLVIMLILSIGCWILGSIGFFKGMVDYKIIYGLMCWLLLPIGGFMFIYTIMKIMKRKG